MKPVLVWLRLRWPREVEADALLATWRMLASSGGRPLVVESTGARGMVIHRLAVPYAKQKNIIRQMQAAMPGIEVVEDFGPEAREPLVANRVLSLAMSSPYRSLNTESMSSTCSAILTALAGVRGDERLVLQWVLGRHLAPRAIPSHSGPLFPPASQLLGHVVQGAPARADGEVRRALAKKQAEPGWRAVGRLAVVAASEHRQSQLLSQLIGAISTVEGPGVRVRLRKVRPASVTDPSMPWLWPLRLNIREMATVSSWPVGELAELPVESGGSRRLRASRQVPRSGKVLGVEAAGTSNRTVALSAQAALRHLHVLGPTGVGKSTTLLNLIVQDMDQGRGLVVIEPKGDLIEDVLARVPSQRLDDVVLLDPTDEEAVVGLNPLNANGRPPELVADQVLAVFHRLHSAHWGPRTHDILGNALATLVRVPDMTLVTLPLLLTDARFRRQVVGQLDDPVALEPFWAAFEAWSDAERTIAIAPVLNKLRPFLVNPRLRAVLGQAKPRFDLRQIFTDRSILLVNLSKGRVGPEAASLLGSLVIAQLWQAALGRSALPAERRHPVFFYLDEFQDYLHLPVDLADALGQARGLGLGMTLAHQHLGQLDGDVRSAVLANARSRLCFQLANEDASVMARGSKLEPGDFTQLPAFEGYAQIFAADAVQPWCSIRTLPAGPGSDSTSGLVRRRSQDRFAVPVEAVEAELRRLVGNTPASIPDDMKPKRRRGGPQ